MNRNQRRLGRVHQKRCEDRKYLRSVRSKGAEAELEEVFPPKNKRNTAQIDKFTTNKCCYVAPVREDFGQITEDNASVDKYQDIVKEQYGCDSTFVPETLIKLKELRKILCKNTSKVDCSSQFTTDKKHSTVEFPDAVVESQWQNIDNAEDIDKYINHGKERLNTCLHLPDNVKISETPRIKIIAKKFSRFKKNNIELRKLDEKVVCVEYDVHLENSVQPNEKLRAFFSIKPTYESEENNKDNTNQDKSSNIYNKFKIASDDLKQLNEKEIEIIDGKIQENKSYLEDLKRILRRKQALYAKKNKNTLDLMALYEMAKKESPPLDDEFSNTNFLSNAELQEMKDLIMRKCASSVHGISRRTMKKEPEQIVQNLGVISQSIVAELWREGGSVLN